MERNFKIIVSFLGKNYNGWQKQKNKKTVQEIIENTLKEVFKKDIKLIGCGRTDSKVNGINYVANFKLETKLSPLNIKNALNSKLPTDIYIKNVEEVDLNFHSRYSAKRKVYRYIIALNKTPFLNDFAYYIKEKINIKKMEEATKFLIGKHDFKSFQSSGSNVKNTIREIFNIEIKKEKFFIDNDVNILIIDIEGSGFLYKMVRNLIGALLYVGKEKIQPEKIKEIIEKKDRKFAPPPVPANGLFFKNAKY
ncbi:MAG: tRNA pseudouridine(38-40) synthase TruA [Candidatus Omnitrophica bacterium]|nr:tRNA pseudouridine(38-40) synthase TruA [Candidatus Omnitrophota bacterium]MCM8809646.1 tRNA pseudouridine(38-40) synthase TruA [Candidatus Omnitrophota bacterium]MCM8811417.1 tRNA pseudouridine(38-40) synthase TruA [Candidatus Omnitrophota bacterium]